MTRSEQVARLRPYVRDLAGRMCLKDWRVEVLEDTPSQKWHGADIETISGKKDARIRLCLDFFGKPPEFQREYLCHELIHLHLAQLDDYLRDILSESQETSYNLLRELSVDEMAHALAPSMPLPPGAEAATGAVRKGRK